MVPNQQLEKKKKKKKCSVPGIVEITLNLFIE